MAEVAYLKNGSVKIDDEEKTCEDGGDENTESSPMSCASLDHPGESKSFRLKLEEISGWINHSARYDQDGSTRGNTNPKSQHRHQSSICSNPTAASTSQRFSVPIIGIPQRLQHSGYLGRSTRRRRVRLFPKRKKGKHNDATVCEPTSPKVSCLGKVRSQKDRITTMTKERGFSMWRWFASLACWNNYNDKSTGDEEEEEGGTESKTWTTDEDDEKVKTKAAAVPAVPAAPGLGGLRRFSSGRRAALWPDDGDDDVGPASV